mgnify:CR=1 FL=1
MQAILDVGFRSYKLADTNFAKWRLSSDVEEDALQQHLLSLRDSATDDATADDLLTEILLKQGYSLSEAISPARPATPAGIRSAAGLRFCRSGRAWRCPRCRRQLSARTAAEAAKHSSLSGKARAATSSS